MPIGIARMKFVQVGASPSRTFSTSVSGESTSTAPISTNSNCVMKSMTASRMLRPADSLIPITFTRTSSAITAAPKMMSPGADRSGSQNRPPM
jgi:hypothetical protein